LGQILSWEAKKGCVRAKVTEISRSLVYLVDVATGEEMFFQSHSIEMSLLKGVMCIVPDSKPKIEPKNEEEKDKMEITIKAPELVDALNRFTAAFNNANEPTTKSVSQNMSIKDPLPSVEDLGLSLSNYLDAPLIEEPVTHTVTLEVVQDLIKALLKAKKIEQVKTVLSKYNASKLATIPKEKYADVMADLEKIV